MDNLKNKQWWEAAAVRAIKTFAQVAVSMLTVGQAVTDINWLSVVSVAGVSAIASLLTSFAGLPEVSSTTVEEEQEENDEGLKD